MLEIIGVEEVAALSQHFFLHAVDIDDDEVLHVLGRD